MVHYSHRRALRARASLPVLLLGLLLPLANTALAVPGDTREARWKNGDLIAPLPTDPAKRAQALSDAKQNAAVRAGTRRANVTLQAQVEPVVRPIVTSPHRAGHDRTRGRAFAPGTFSSPLLDRAPLRPAPSSTPPAASRHGDEPAPSPGLGQTFEGIDDTGWTPASPDIAVGPDHVMMVTSDAFAVYDKCGNWLDGGNILEYFGIVTDALFYDPRVVYDDWNNRWVMAWIAYDIGGNQSWVEVFATTASDPTDGWLPGRSLGWSSTHFADNMYLAVDPTSIYLTYNQFAIFDYGFYRCRVYVVDSEEFYANPGTATASYFAGLTDADASYSFAIRPAQMNSYPGEMYLINNKFQGGSVGRVWTVFNTPDAPQATHDDLSYIAYSPPLPLQQANGTYLRSLDARYMDVVYQYGTLYAARSSTASSSSGNRSMIFIDHVDPVAGVRTQTDQLYTGAYNRAFPAIDLDEYDNIFCAFAQCEPTGFVSLAYEMLESNTGTRWYGTIAAGEALYTLGGAGTSGNPYRWGNYTGGAIDPVDDRSFWIGGAYASSDPIPSWETRIGVVSAFPAGYLDVSPMEAQVAGGISGGHVLPREFTYTLTNNGGMSANWQLGGVPYWLTPTISSGQIPPGGSQDITLAINLAADYLPVGTHNAILDFKNCTGSGGVIRSITVAIVEPNLCDGAGIDLAPPGVTGESAQGPGEYGVFITAMEDIDVCALGVDISGGRYELTARIYEADGLTRGALLAENTQWSIDYIPTALASVPFDITLHACQDYELVFEIPGDQWFTTFDENGFDPPYDVNGLVHVRLGSESGTGAPKLPHMGILAATAPDPVNDHTTDLFPGGPAGTAHDSDASVGLFVTALENMELRAIGFEADLNRDTRVSAVLYPAAGETRLPTVLTSGWKYVTESGMRYHEIPLYHTFKYGEEYDLSVHFEGSGYWPVVNEFDTLLPDTVDGAVVVRRAESAGTVSLLVPHFYFKWKDAGTGGSGFDLAKPGGPAPNSTTGTIDHGAYVTSLVEQTLYGMGVMADIPEGSFLFARVYAADGAGANRVGLITEGLITTAEPGMRWHDVPLAVELQAGQNYDIAVICGTPGQYDYWDDTTGLPYDAYGTIQVLDGEIGGWAGNPDLLHLRVHACNEVLTGVAEQAPEFSTLFIGPAAPNPTGGMSTFEYTGAGQETADMEIYDVLGRRVATVFSGRRLSAGVASAQFDASSLASGVYFVTLRTPTRAVSRKFVVTR